MRLGLIGGGASVEAYARALRQLAEAELATVVAASPGRGLPLRATACGDPATLIALPSLQAVVLASDLVHPYPLIRRALAHGRHVLAAGPFTLAADQIQRLSSLAERNGRLLMFAEERMLSPGFVLLSGMGKGASRSGFRYLRLLDVRPRRHQGSMPLSAIAVEGLALCLRLAHQMPRSINAVAAGPLEELPQATFITLLFPGGPVASLQVSVSEDWEARQIVASMPGRTLILDELDYRMPLHIVSAGDCSHRQAAGAPVPDGVAWQTGSLTLAAPPGDPTLQQCQRFLDALASGQVGAVNGDLWSRAAKLWEGAEKSAALAGAPVPLENDHRHPDSKSPPARLYVIGGRAQPEPSLSPRPALTLVPV